ncbi:MAG TPA: FAD-binding oxidoreductase [Rhizomicrobium sp.]|jgi:FAD/FMN-containing dehydrogenase
MSVLDRLKSVSRHSEDQAEIAPHLVEWRGKYQGGTKLLLLPDTTAQVSQILAICDETRTQIVPQGGNTGLVGGQIPMHGEVLLSLTRMNRIRDVAGDAMIAEAGVVLAAAKEEALRHERFFPLSLASEGSCTIGGNLSTNAGGVDVLRYGNARELVLGLEVVLASGEVLNMLRTLRKDNTGYDLKQLFIGAEGTLGVITAAALKLFPKPETRETAFVAVPDPASAIALLSRAQAATGGLISAFELMPRVGLDLVLAHIPQTADPLSKPSPWYVLIEATGGAAMPLRTILENTLSRAIEDGLVTDATLAASEAQHAALWRLRESMSEAQKPEGGSIKHDVSLPIRAIPEFLVRGAALVETIVPGARPVPFGHLGDGNIHFNISVPKGGNNQAFLASWQDVAHAVHDLVASYGGSISAEHGIGYLKRDDLPRYKSAAEMALMRTLKRTLDPNGILNPGKLL